MWLNGGKFLERQKGDTYQFRLIVAPEDAGHMAALKPFVRDLMRDMEKDLATQLDWVAADHFNTGHPHTHIIIAGHDDRGEALVMARHYILMSQVKHNARDNSSPAYRRGVELRYGSCRGEGGDSTSPKFMAVFAHLRP